MRTLMILLIALVIAGSADAQRRARIGPTVSTISIDDGSGNQSFTSFGGAFALLSGDDGEIGAAVSRYGDLSNNSCVRQMTFIGLESNYYPVGPKGIAPYASTSVGLARVTDQDAGLLGVCTAAQPTSELGLGFGLGVRLNIGAQAAALVEGRFFQVPNSAIQALEARANISLAFGSPRKTQMLNGTLGPAIGFLVPLGGPMEGRSPTIGVRFRRDTKKGSLGLQIDYAQLRASSCSSDCSPNAILFAPGVEPSLRPAWGRLYFDLGLLLVGIPSVGGDRGMAQGAHAGIGADIVGSGPLINLNSRVLWFQRNGGGHVFLLQTGVSVSPKLESR
ncbi:MAG: hypothetical protein ACREMI_14695 [Gemmatimonadales bacterium]